MKKLLNSTATLTLSVALAMPTGGFAQSASDLPTCAGTDVQEAFPCRLVVGGIVSEGEALRQVRQNVQEAQQRAEAEGRTLTPEEVRVIVDNTPGILSERASAQQPQTQPQNAESAEAPVQVQPRSEQPAPAAAAGNSESTQVQVVTEQETVGEVRSSNEEFATAVTGEGQTAPQAGGDDDGLSKFEKALLLGLGAVAVGAVLKNGDRIVSRTGDRVVVENPEGELRVLKDDDALIRRPGDEVQTENYADGSTRTIVTKADGSQVITIRASNGAVIRRVNVDAQGNRVVLFDDTVQEQEVVVTELPQIQPRQQTFGTSSEEELRAALAAQMTTDQNRSFSLRQIREIQQVRALAPEIELDAVQFATGSAAIQPEQARSLARIGTALSEIIARDPRTVILVEGHTDAVGDATYNLALSDRRAETVALALTEYFRVPPENMITQGYGESALKIRTLDAEAANRRAVVRNITGLLR